MAQEYTKAELSAVTLKPLVHGDFKVKGGRELYYDGKLWGYAEPEHLGAHGMRLRLLDVMRKAVQVPNTDASGKAVGGTYPAYVNGPGWHGKHRDSKTALQKLPAAFLTLVKAGKFPEPDSVRAAQQAAADNRRQISEQMAREYNQERDSIALVKKMAAMLLPTDPGGDEDMDSVEELSHLVARAREIFPQDDPQKVTG